ncbi:MAG: methionyl-tRNA formyltransferase [Lachnospiraceae bacterium]|nr:methionyl-tRNA formyltransferase [Lachnospiraceae bacterium]
MRISWIGNHEEGLEAFRQTAEKGYVTAFITLDDEAFAKRSAGSRDYGGICERFGIPVYPVDTIKGERAYEILKEQQPELLVVLGWSEILPKRLLDIPTIGTVGTHAALLPHNRGSAPINWALIRGEEETGNTLMWLSAEVDAGEIADQRAFPISLFDTCKTLYDRVAETNAEMIDALIRKLEAGRRPVLPIRNKSDEAILPRRRPKDGLLNWQQGARQIYDFIRALTIPYPGAFSYLNGKKYLLWEAMVLPAGSEAEPGTILGMAYGFGERGCGLCVATKDSILCITLLEDGEGKRYSGRELYELGLSGCFTDYDGGE